MNLYDCPACGSHETVHVRWIVGTYPEVDAVECGCRLSADQAKAIEDAAARRGPDDELEPEA